MPTSSEKLSINNVDRDAVDFISTLWTGCPNPSRFQALDGEVVLEWRSTNGDRAIVSIEGDGLYGYCMKIDGKYMPGTGDGVIGAPIPDDLAGYLRRMS